MLESTSDLSTSEGSDIICTQGWKYLTSGSASISDNPICVCGNGICIGLRCYRAICQWIKSRRMSYQQTDSRCAALQPLAAQRFQQQMPSGSPNEILKQPGCSLRKRLLEHQLSEARSLWLLISQGTRCVMLYLLQKPDALPSDIIRLQEILKSDNLHALQVRCEMYMTSMKNTPQQKKSITTCDQW